MARIVRFYETGGPEVLKIEQLDVPPPGKGEVQISVKALGLNRAESMFRRGEYIEQPVSQLASGTRRPGPSPPSARAATGSRSAMRSAPSRPSP